MKERPILMNAAMVRATLAGTNTKSQTRRVVKLPHENPLGKWEVIPWGGPNGGRTREGNTVPFQNVIAHSRTGEIFACPYGQPGDRLWVRERFAPRDGITIINKQREEIFYWADVESKHWSDGAWKPSIHMPRWASRITLGITGVRVERLQEISEADTIAEGTPGGHGAIPGYSYNATPSEHYRALWEQINGAGSWAANPWVWVVEFKRIKP